jgi:hypothetical protein
LSLGAAPAFGIDFTGEEAAFDEAAPVPFGAAGAFGVVAFRSDTFACFLVGPTPAPFFLFFVASLLAPKPGSKWKP